MMALLLAKMMMVPYVFEAGINLMSFSFSMLIGTVFGFFRAPRCPAQSGR